MWFKLIIPFTLLCLCVFVSCKKNKIENIQSEVEKNVSEGTWEISKFQDDEKNETADFKNYAFTFQTNGQLIAVDGSNNYTGTWSVEKSNSSNDDIEFHIKFNDSTKLADLNDDWDLLSQTEIKIELMDVSGGNGGTDFLTFKKK